MQPAVTKEVIYYEADDGTYPVHDWLECLLPKRKVEYTKVMQRISRAGLGNLGDHRFLDGAMGELKIDYGPGYRVYFGLDGNEIILLLNGGTKETQQQDISLAKEHWQNYLEVKKKRKQEEERHDKGKKS